jgi:hypothetical protein
MNARFVLILLLAASAALAGPQGSSAGGGSHSSGASPARIQSPLPRLKTPSRSRENSGVPSAQRDSNILCTQNERDRGVCTRDLRVR